MVSVGIMIQLLLSPISTLAIKPPGQGLIERVRPLWGGRELLKHIHPIRSRSRKEARSPFIRSDLVAASRRVEEAGLPESYRLFETAREYVVSQDCEEVIVRLASRIGDPRIAPVPPLWPLLALVLFEWRHDISAYAVLEHARAMGFEEEVERGLAVVTYLFPELQDWMTGVPVGIPLWESALAVPLSARKLVLLEKSV